MSCQILSALKSEVEWLSSRRTSRLNFTEAKLMGMLMRHKESYVSRERKYKSGQVAVIHFQGAKVNILGGHSIVYSKQKWVYVHVPYSERFSRYSYFTVQYTVCMYEGCTIGSFSGRAQFRK
jgi:hypothetical protein